MQHADVDETLDGRIEPVTAAKYKRRNNEFKVWIQETVANAKTTAADKARLTTYLKPPEGALESFDSFAHAGNARLSLLNLTEEFQVKDWMKFVRTRKLGSGDNAILKGIGSLCEYRSAFYHEWVQACTQRGENRPANMEESIRSFFTSLGKKDADERLKGIRKVKVGKDAMPVAAFVLLMREWLNPRYGKEGVFARAYLAVSWNLMCRMANTASLHAHHLAWSGDCFSTVFSRTKTDRQGEARDGAKHIFSNPLEPDIDVLLALAIYLAVFEPDNKVQDDDDVYASSALFPGSHQQKRFVEMLQRAFKEKHIEKAMRQLGVSIDDIAGHSIRKGASTFVASGTTAAPNYGALCRRAGWSLGVQERYIFLLSAADRYIGRIVCGLPIDKFEFATLPAHFPVGFDCDVETDLQFGRWVDEVGLNELLPFCLAALIQHKDWLTEKLESSGAGRHAVFDTPFFTNASEFIRVKGSVIESCTSSHHMKATGLPPMTIVLGEIQQLKAMVRDDKEFKENVLQQLATMQQSLPEMIATAVNEKIDERALELGAITMPALDDKFRALTEAFVKVVDDKLQQLGVISEDGQPASEKEGPDEEELGEESPWKKWEYEKWTPDEDAWSVERYMFDSLVPPDFWWRDLQLRQSFLLWYRGDETQGIVPYRELNPNLFPVSTYRGYYEEDTVKEHLENSKSQKARVPPTSMADRMARAKAQVTKFNNTRRVIDFMNRHSKAASPEQVAPILAKIDEDDEEAMLPDGSRSMRCMPTAREVEVLFQEGKGAIRILDEHHEEHAVRKRKRYITRGNHRNVSTIERLLRDYKKHKALDEGDSASEDNA